jgi:hypothetical protein
MLDGRGLISLSNRLRNIEETEKAKRSVDENKYQRKKVNADEEHLVAQRCMYLSFYVTRASYTMISVYRPGYKAKSDADILRDAKLEAMGLPPQVDSPRRSNHERTLMATDEIVRPCANLGIR